MNVNHLKQQHEVIYQLIGEIEANLNLQYIEADAFNLSLKLAQLSGKLTMHLKSEDDFLYPSLQSSSDQKLREIGVRFSQEMNGIAGRFTEYKSQYLAASKIKVNPEKFIQETRAIFAVLKKRLNTEDKDLYAVVNL